MPMLLYKHHCSSLYLTGEAGSHIGQTTGPDSCEWAGGVPAGQGWYLEDISHQGYRAARHSLLEGRSRDRSEMTIGAALVLDDFLVGSRHVQSLVISLTLQYPNMPMHSPVCLNRSRIFPFQATQPVSVCLS